MAAEMSSPSQTWPSLVSASPLRPLPQPMSSSSRGAPSSGGGSASSSSARWVASGEWRESEVSVLPVLAHLTAAPAKALATPTKGHRTNNSNTPL
jgi:hypothetical protein